MVPMLCGDSSGCIIELKAKNSIILVIKHIQNGPRHEKTCLRAFANNKGADYPAYSLIGKYHIVTCHRQNFKFLASLCT